MDSSMVGWATRLGERELGTVLPRRWAHSQGVAARAAGLGYLLGKDTVLLEAAATLHDFGYTPRLAVTGFHPLDGARFLRDEHGADERLVRLVANRSFVLLEAEERGLRKTLEAEFPLLSPRHTGVPPRTAPGRQRNADTDHDITQPLMAVP
ncbi:HD domain-containing protein [Streptomyces qinzhouensis]|uniref:HD domain-containing protein n=2 Tax=Streptomyces qinzhouensis TaxID=2599401 RepID=A0A5B8JMA4_9ACTN|nr:HD domain-containing protein [Streptomyces qinzhouensis]QDY81031.1 HD domain-containing protein [Streptomyces qinzhouensis]